MIKKSLGIMLFISAFVSSCKSTITPVADIENKKVVWETPAFSRPDSKYDEMKIRKNRNSIVSVVEFVFAIKSHKYSPKAERKIDTQTYKHSLKKGYLNDTFDDQPYIIPYLIPNSKGAVIVVPGGGYAFQSIDGATFEGKDIAVKLNEAGYSAFVMHYRANPYHYPAPMLDLQRAVRYIKYHSDDFNINPNKISAIGYSAGGNLVATYINIIQGKNHFPANYQKDEIDAMDDSLASAAMIYPALTYQYNVNMLFSMFDSQLVNNKEEREKLLQLTDLPQHIRTEAVPQFVSYSKKDRMVDYRGTERYISAAKDKGVALTVSEVKNQDHTYKPIHYWEDYQSFLLQTLTK